MKEQIMQEFKQYLEDSKVKAEILAIISDIDSLQSKIDALETHIAVIDANDYAKRLIEEAGIPTWSPILTGNLSVKKAVAEYSQMQEKLKSICKCCK